MPGLRYADGKHTFFQGRYVTVGTSPPGSAWAQNPIPRIHFDSTSSGQPASYAKEFNCTHPAHGVGCRQFDPYACEEMAVNPQYDAPWGPVLGAPPRRLNTDIEGICSGDWVSGEITDNVIIPGDLPTGDYVVGFRWDCEYDWPPLLFRPAALYKSLSAVILTFLFCSRRATLVGRRHRFGAPVQTFILRERNEDSGVKSHRSPHTLTATIMTVVTQHDALSLSNREVVQDNKSFHAMYSPYYPFP